MTEEARDACKTIAGFCSRSMQGSSRGRSTLKSLDLDLRTGDPFGTVFRYDGKDGFIQKVRRIQSNGESFDNAIRVIV